MATLRFNIPLINNMNGMQLTDEYTLSAVNTKNEVIDVVVRKCRHCNEFVPEVGTCPDCNMPYEHMNTVENPQTGFIHFIYECAGCPPAKRKAQKIIRINDGDNGRNKTRKNDLIKSFF